jgi:outer membrane protein TolC
MKKIIKYISMFLFIGSITASSQTLEDYLKIAAENNPELKSKFYSYQISLQKIPQVGSLPDPELSFGIFIEPMQRYMGNQVAEISVMQMFPWFGTLSAAEDEAALMSKAKYEEFNEAKSMLYYEVKAIWNMLYLLHKEIAITEENIEILQVLEDLAINRLSSGAGTNSSSVGSQMSTESSTGSTGDMSGMGTQQQSTGQSTQTQNMNSSSEMSSGNGMVDVLRVQIEMNELKNKLALLQDSKQPLFAQFNGLLNRPRFSFVNIPDSITADTLPSRSEILGTIRLNNPMLLMMQREEESHLAHERMSRKMGFPMIGLGVQYSIFESRPPSQDAHGIQTGMEAKNMIMPMVTVSIPIWRGKYDAAIKESELLHLYAGERKQEIENQLMVSYEEAIKDFTDAERRVSLYQQQTQLAKQALNILTAGYTTAGNNFEELLQMQRQLLDYKFRELDAVVDQNIAAAMLERLMGR